MWLSQLFVYCAIESHLTVWAWLNWTLLCFLLEKRVNCVSVQFTLNHYESSDKLFMSVICSHLYSLSKRPCRKCTIDKQLIITIKALAHQPNRCVKCVWPVEMVVPWCLSAEICSFASLRRTSAQRAEPPSSSSPPHLRQQLSVETHRRWFWEYWGCDVKSAAVCLTEHSDGQLTGQYLALGAIMRCNTINHTPTGHTGSQTAMNQQLSTSDCCHGNQSL